jgi:hypothetical protein
MTLATIAVGLAILSTHELGRLVLALEVARSFVGADLFAPLFPVGHYILVLTVSQEFHCLVNTLGFAEAVVDLSILGAPVHESQTHTRAFGLALINLGLFSALFFAVIAFSGLAFEELDKILVFAKSLALTRVELSIGGAYLLFLIVSWTL